MIQPLIAVSGEVTGQLSATEHAMLVRDELLLHAEELTEVSSPETAQFAGEVLKDLKRFMNEIEAAREEVKAPVLARGKAIDALAKKLTAEVSGEYARIGNLLGPYQEEQQKKVEEARQAAWAEEQRLLAEARKAEAKAAAEANARLASLASEVAGSMADQKAKAELAQEISNQAHAESDARMQEVAKGIVEARNSALAVAPGKVSGISTRSNIEFTVTDAKALYEAFPMFLELVPRAAVIKAALKDLREGETIPGLTWRRVAGISTRT